MESRNFSIIRLNTLEEIQKIYPLRYKEISWKYWEGKTGKTKEKFFYEEKERDKDGIILVFQDEQSNIIASLRLLKINHVLNTTRKIIESNNIKINYSSNTWELSRVVILPHKRNFKNLVRFLYLSSKWLVKNKKIKYILAHCEFKFVKLYTKLGCKIISNNLITPYKENHLIISSNLLESIEAMEKLISFFK